MVCFLVGWGVFGFVFLFFVPSNWFGVVLMKCFIHFSKCEGSHCSAARLPAYEAGEAPLAEISFSVPVQIKALLAEIKQSTVIYSILVTLFYSIDVVWVNFPPESRIHEINLVRICWCAWILILSNLLQLGLDFFIYNCAMWVSRTGFGSCWAIGGSHQFVNFHMDIGKS